MTQATVDSLEPAEYEAFEFLRSHGFAPQIIPRSNVETPDFEATFQNEEYLFEVKARRDEDTLTTLPPGEMFSSSSMLFRSSNQHKNISKAVSQMRTHDPTHSRLWVGWLCAEALFADAVDQIRGTLLGVVSVVDLEDLEGKGRDCFYAQVGAFERFPQLDAAVISSEEGYQLWINEFARPQLLIESELGRLFRSKGALHLPAEHEAAGTVYLMTAGVGKMRSDADVQRHLKERYQLQKPILLRPKTHLKAMAVKAELVGPDEER